eukprot:GEZU01021095.1.p1 GENE.GEZU01021095.1~~GEZU01021095.1.p1  ORF type:complete len:100 (-),score=5.58 GEZU01021095.1:35-334(-)
MSWFCCCCGHFYFVVADDSEFSTRFVLLDLVAVEESLKSMLGDLRLRTLACFFFSSPNNSRNTLISQRNCFHITYQPNATTAITAMIEPVVTKNPYNNS